MQGAELSRPSPGGARAGQEPGSLPPCYSPEAVSPSCVVTGHRSALRSERNVHLADSKPPPPPHQRTCCLRFCRHGCARPRARAPLGRQAASARPPRPVPCRGCARHGSGGGPLGHREGPGAVGGAGTVLREHRPVPEEFPVSPWVQLTCWSSGTRAFPSLRKDVTEDSAEPRSPHIQGFVGLHHATMSGRAEHPTLLVGPGLPGARLPPRSHPEWTGLVGTSDAPVLSPRDLGVSGTRWTWGQRAICAPVTTSAPPSCGSSAGPRTQVAVQRPRPE